MSSIGREKIVDPLQDIILDRAKEILYTTDQDYQELSTGLAIFMRRLVWPTMQEIEDDWD